MTTCTASLLAQHSIPSCQLWHCEERKGHLRKLKLRSSNFAEKCEGFVLLRSRKKRGCEYFAMHFAVLRSMCFVVDIDSDIERVQIFIASHCMQWVVRI
jgi:hypothetical protein